jgi:5-methylcytosine-specific restriction endonuclease McrA
MSDSNAESFSWQNDPFEEDFVLVPPEEEVRARAEQVLRDNRDALRHFVESAIWEALDQPDHLKILVTLLWHWKAVEPKWVAEASFMTVADVRDIAESQAMMVFPCLVCGTELPARNRLHEIRMQSSVEDYCEDRKGRGIPANLLCETCQEQIHDQIEQQQRLDRERYQSLLAEYRTKPYAERRGTREWAILKKQVHRRDRYRCRLCGRDDVELHVHHCTYANYGEERLEDLITLCSECHRRFHFLPDVS